MHMVNWIIYCVVIIMVTQIGLYMVMSIWLCYLIELKRIVTMIMFFRNWIAFFTVLTH